MEIISGYVQILKKDEYIKLDLIESFWIGNIFEDFKWFFFAQIGNRSYRLAQYETEQEAKEGMNLFLIQLTPECDDCDHPNGI